MKNSIVLTGMPGSGKSTVGVILAKVLCKPFFDTDLLIQEKEGRSLQAILDQEGPDYFRRCEERHILQHSFPPSVIATGGSVVYSQAAMEHLKRDATVVFLNVSYENLCRRIRNFSTRGILTHGSSLLDLYHERLPLYERYADIILDCLDQSIEETVEAVVGTLK